MRTLVIETATEACSVALFEDDRLVANHHEILGRGHAERLVPMVSQLPRAGRSERILVSRGPGSFTGIRVGIAAARALGLAWDAKVLGYPTLSLVAAMAQKTGNDVLACMNGGHGQWFVQAFDEHSSPLTEILSIDPVDAPVGHALIAGNRALQFVELHGSPAKAVDILPDASEVGKMKPECLSANVAPVYGRRPDARLPQSL